jgi:hypothetical protein
MWSWKCMLNPLYKPLFWPDSSDRWEHIQSLQVGLAKLGPLHTRDWEPVTLTLQALSLVGKAELVQVRFTLRLRDQHSTYVNARWMYNLHGFLDGIKWIMFHGHLDYFQKPPLERRSNTKLGDHGTLIAHNCWFILFYHVWGSAWIKYHWNSIRLRAQSHMTSHYTWKSVTMLHEFGNFSFGLSQSHGHGSWLVCEVALRTHFNARYLQHIIRNCATTKPC